MSDSEEETPINVIGDIPMEWYDQFEHIGYTSEGKKVIPKERPDAIEEVIRRSTDPDWARRIYDRLAGEFKLVSAEDLEMIERIRSGKVALKDFEMYPEMKETKYEDSIYTLTDTFKARKHYQPNKGHIRKIHQLMAAIRRGEMDEKEQQEDDSFDIWDDSFQVRPLRRMAPKAPKMPRPETDESYHPPNDKNPTRLMEVPGYEKALKERFERAEDLYLCPRVYQKRMPELSKDLLPTFTDPEELKPYPTFEAVRYVGHTGRIRSISFSPTGTFMASGSSDGTVKVWETLTGRCLHTYDLKEYTAEDAAVVSVGFCPAVETPIVAACCKHHLFVIRLNKEVEFPAEDEEIFNYAAPDILAIRYKNYTGARQVEFNRTGSFMAVLYKAKHVIIFNLRTWEYRAPLKSTKGYIQAIKFHPNKGQLFVCTQKFVMVFDLVERRKIIQLKPMAQWLSSIDVHPRGDHVLAGSYDGKSFWFDTELQSTPFKTLRNHEAAVRDTVFHKRFPLFATCSDDACVHIFHGAVFDDLVTNPLIIPVKELTGHQKNGVLGVLCVAWHPTQPWLVSGGADHSIRLWT